MNRLAELVKAANELREANDLAAGGYEAAGIALRAAALLPDAEVVWEDPSLAPNMPRMAGLEWRAEVGKAMGRVINCGSGGWQASVYIANGWPWCVEGYPSADDAKRDCETVLRLLAAAVEATP